MDDARLAQVAEAFRGAVETGRDIRLDFTRLKTFGMGFAGQILMLEKVVMRRQRLTIVGASRSVCRALDLCGLDYLRR